MKYTTEITIDLPLDQCIQKFSNPENLKEWQPGLQSYEVLSGEPGKAGSKMKLVFIMRNKPMEIVETIEKNELPHRLDVRYETKGVQNWVKNYFKEVENNKTQWTTHNEFKFQGLMKIFGLLMPGAFKKESFKYMTLFKEFAE